MAQASRNPPFQRFLGGARACTGRAALAMAWPAGNAQKRPGPPVGSPPPVAKARIAKSSSPAGSPVAAKSGSLGKAPVTKAPVTKAPVAKAPVAKAPVAKAPAQPQAEVPKAANGTTTPAAAGRTDSWKEFADSDPLYALIGQVSQHKVVGPDGSLDNERLQQYFERAIIQKATKKPKDWVELWAAMDVPVTNQALVLEPLVAFGLEHSPETLGNILAELLKGHRVKTKTIEESVLGAYKGRGDSHGILREMLFLIFPKGPQSAWGWSRIGWSWQEWWKILENCYVSINKTSAFDELAALLNRIEAEGNMPLSKQPTVWNEQRLGKARALLCKLGDVEDENDLVACLDATLR
uniref:Uncharacterized protein n=1 Tax=Pyrodinium bahamense TaxID=73915 RepID=A0A7S0FAS5_9DINO